MSERVLITGAPALAGRWLRRALLDRGFAVRCFDAVSRGRNGAAAQGPLLLIALAGV